MDTETATTTASALAAAVRSGAWPVVAGLGITLLVSIARAIKLLDALNPPYRRWVAVGLAVAATLGAGLAGGAPLLDILLATVTTAATAIGLHEISKGTS